MTKLLQLPEIQAYARRQFSHWDDFYSYTDAGLWTKTTTDSGTVAAASPGGILTLTPSDGSVADNDECYVATTASLFLFDVDSTIRVGALLNFTELNTNKANVAFGLMNSVGANSILDDGGGPAASFSGAVFYKMDGGTVWNVRSSIGTTKTDTALTTTAGGGYQYLEIEYKAKSLTEGKVSFWINGAQVLDPNAGYPKPLQHLIDATSCANMQLFVGVKNGDANNQTVLVDGIGWGSIR